MISTILLVAVSISFIAYAYYHPPKNFLSAKNPNTICMNYTNEPFSQLKVNLVHNMTNGYKQNQLQHIKAVMNDDAHSISFELETLKRFIYHIEINEKNNGVSSNDLGLRIYYSRYPGNETWNQKYDDLKDFLSNPLTKDFENRHTLVMIPTINKEGVRTDFNPLDKDTYFEKMARFSKYQSTDIVTSIPALTSTKNLNQPGSSSAQNHGSLIPPADGSGESF